MSHEFYDNPLITRYASQEMARIWSEQTKHSLWRELWVALAECEQKLGLNIRDDQIAQMKAHTQTIDFARAREHEKKLRHDVMAHVHTFGDQCPDAKPIIHLGATSCYVTDNSELIQMKRSLELLTRRIVQVIDKLAKFAETYRDLPCLGFTHLQPAQPTTVGKRATLWLQDLVLDLEELEHRLNTLSFRGVKGTTGTQASFLELFNGKHELVEQLDELVTARMGFSRRCLVTGQTYSRKVDAQILAALSGIGQTGHKAGTDIRILQHRKEIEEPFEKNQIGSSAMAYKRNPMRSERMCSLARFAMSQTVSGDQTAATQWMERTLDDSAIRRISLPQSFLAIDAVLILYGNIVDGLVVYPKVIEKNLRDELPFMATEEILMAAVKAGGDRQDLHEKIRVFSQEAGRQVKEFGLANDLLERLKKDDVFSKVDYEPLMDPKRFIGRAPQQVDYFIAAVINPIRTKYSAYLGGSEEELRV
jgi:adenylosuccinate lyase